MPTLIQRLHPALYPGQRLALAGTRRPLFSHHGASNAGSTLRCVAMTLALLEGRPIPSMFAATRAAPLHGRTSCMA